MAIDESNPERFQGEASMTQESTMSATEKALRECPVIDSDEARLAQKAADDAADLPPDRIDVDPMKITQHWEKYTAENHEVWGLLYEKRMEQLADFGSRVFLDGAEVIKLNKEQVPKLTEVNQRLQEFSNWASWGVPGYLPAKAFFAFLAQRQFPTTITVRPKFSMDYLPEPDIIHDVFGHVPLHANRIFADFLQTFGKAALYTNNAEHTERLARLFWFTVEFGLIHEDGKTKLYGSGLISSDGEGHHALESKDVERRAFDLDRVCETTFEIDHYQPILYVLESFEQLKESMLKYAEKILEEEGRVDEIEHLRD